MGFSKPLAAFNTVAGPMPRFDLSESQWFGVTWSDRKEFDLLEFDLSESQCFAAM